MSNQNAEDMKAIEITIEHATKKVKMAEQLERLHENKDFMALIVDGYLKDYAVRMVNLKATVLNPDDVLRINLKIDAIGGLYAYFQAIFAEGEHAALSMEQAEEAREEILAEDSAESEA